MTTTTVAGQEPPASGPSRVLELAEQLKRVAPQASSLVDIIVENYVDALLSLLDDVTEWPADYGQSA